MKTYKAVKAFTEWLKNSNMKVVDVNGGHTRTFEGLLHDFKNEDVYESLEEQEQEQGDKINVEKWFLEKYSPYNNSYDSIKVIQILTDFYHKILSQHPTEQPDEEEEFGPVDLTNVEPDSLDFRNQPTRGLSNAEIQDNIPYPKTIDNRRMWKNVGFILGAKWYRSQLNVPKSNKL